jgi:hypothetical protein
VAVVEVRELVKHFEGGRVHAIDGVDLAAAGSEYLVLLGPARPRCCTRSPASKIRRAVTCSSMARW